MKIGVQVCALLALCASVASAQPSATAVVGRFKKSPVTEVKVINTTKEWDAKAQKYYWKVSLVKSQPVPPAEVDGLAGVTLLTHVVADYDLGSESPYWSGVTFTEYKGIDLPTPSAGDLSALLEQARGAQPMQFFRSTAGKIGLDRAWTDQPNPEWLNPKKLRFRAKMIFRQEVSNTEVGEIEAPIHVTLTRPSLNGDWAIDWIEQVVESQTELRRMPMSQAGAGAVTMTDAGPEAAAKAELARLKVPQAPKFVTGEALARDLIGMLHNLSRDQYKQYLAMAVTPGMRCSGCSHATNTNGARFVEMVLAAAYDGAGTFRSQYCMEPSGLADENGAIFWKNKDGSAESQIVYTKEAGTYWVTGMTLDVRKDAQTESKLAGVGCDDDRGPASGHSATWQAGDQVLVEENGTWYPSVVLKVRPGEYFIHYEGYSDSYDLWVGPERVKAR
ncbi:MAG: hypothetical protein IT349_19750 [Candidatus Eisenbacteria bacterium]|nr:hypothetical protein [Candidatus Eisenbacteria bacterium]